MLKTLFVILLFPVLMLAQEFNASVSVNMDQLNPGDREKLENFKSSIEDYINKNKFSGKSWDGEKILCNFNIIFTGSGDNNSYNAQLVVTSYRPIEGTKKDSPMMIILDNPWSFTYEKNQPMRINQAEIDPVTSMLDFYLYLMLGFDGDSWQKMGGTDYFKQAYDISLRGASSKYAASWSYSNAPYTKRGLLENILDERYTQFRSDYFNYHYNGLDLINNPKTYDIAIKNIIKLINDIDAVRERLDSRSVLLKVFFDAKYNEICDILKNYPDKTIFSTLKRIDPFHISKYTEMSGDN